MAKRFWLMWGSRDPKKKPPPRIVVKDQDVYSETNYNLWLGLDRAKDEVVEELSLCDLISVLDEPQAVRDEAAYSLREAGSWSYCEPCRDESGVPCQLFVLPKPGILASEKPFLDAVQSLMREKPGEGDVSVWCPCPARFVT